MCEKQNFEFDLKFYRKLMERLTQERHDLACIFLSALAMLLDQLEAVQRIFRRDNRLISVFGAEKRWMTSRFLQLTRTRRTRRPENIPVVLEPVTFRRDFKVLINNQ